MKDTWMVAHDFSPSGREAVFEAARLLPVGGTLRLLHVHPHVSVRPEQGWGEATLDLEITLRAKLELLRAIVKSKHPGMNIEVDVATGDAVAGILQEAQRSNVDHIVVGTHQRTGVAHLVLGSVAERVVREAKVPVLVVKGAIAA